MAAAKWRRRVEQALTRMTAEVAALREQLELRRSTAAAARTKLALVRTWIVYATWLALKHAIIDAIIVAVVLAWMKRRGDKRAELVMKLLGGFMSERLWWKRGKSIMGNVVDRPRITAPPRQAVA